MYTYYISVLQVEMSELIYWMGAYEFLRFIPKPVEERWGALEQAGQFFVKLLDFFSVNKITFRLFVRHKTRGPGLFIEWEIMNFFDF